MKLKRHQILLEHWQTEYLWSFAKKNKVTFCSALRIHLNQAIIKKTKFGYDAMKEEGSYDARKRSEMK
jgi:hypothetical protein